VAFSITNNAFLGGEQQPCDIVVWNPYKDASPADLPPPAFRRFVCVEPGLVATQHQLAPHARAIVSQKIVAT